MVTSVFSTDVSALELGEHVHEYEDGICVCGEEIENKYENINGSDDGDDSNDVRDTAYSQGGSRPQIVLTVRFKIRK